MLSDFWNWTHLYHAQYISFPRVYCYVISSDSDINGIQPVCFYCMNLCSLHPWANIKVHDSSLYYCFAVVFVHWDALRIRLKLKISTSDVTYSTRADILHWIKIRKVPLTPSIQTLFPTMLLSDLIGNILVMSGVRFSVSKISHEEIAI